MRPGRCSAAITADRRRGDPRQPWRSRDPAPAATGGLAVAPISPAATGCGLPGATVARLRSKAAARWPMSSSRAYAARVVQALAWARSRGAACRGGCRTKVSIGLDNRRPPVGQRRLGAMATSSPTSASSRTTRWRQRNAVFLSFSSQEHWAAVRTLRGLAPAPAALVAASASRRRRLRQGCAGQRHCGSCRVKSGNACAASADRAVAPRRQRAPVRAFRPGASAVGAGLGAGDDAGNGAGGCIGQRSQNALHLCPLLWAQGSQLVEKSGKVASVHVAPPLLLKSD
jgi:hypothetical protein